MLELADTFQFQHVPFEAPFGSLAYLDAIRYCVSEGARTVIVDSMSHEHEGAGGMLESADADAQERINRSNDKATPRWKLEQRYKMSGFIKPKADRSKLIQGILQLQVNLILCFRAKEKIQPATGGEPKNLGWLPIGGEEFWYEMTARALLLPGANGVPTWVSELPGEKLAMRRPTQFEKIMANGRQLSEDMGEAMGRWASGAGELSPHLAPALVDPNASGELTEALLRIREATDDTINLVAAELRPRTWSETERKAIGDALKRRNGELRKAREKT